jgi:hypothetical protein
MARQTFYNAYDLAMAVEVGVEKRYLTKDYNISSFLFNSA